MRKLLFFLTLTFVLVAGASANWERGGLFGADVRALVIDPQNPDILYLGTSHGELYVSKDGAASWVNPRAGIPFPGYVVDNLTIDGKGRLWAACWGLWGGGVIAVSDDGGIRWTRRDEGLEEFSVRALALDPSNPETLLAGGLTGVYRTTDSGKSWKQISTQENVESLAVDPRDPQRIYVGTWRQAFRTSDGGKTWSLINNGMVLDTDVFSIQIDPENPDNIWLSTCGWVYNTQDGGDLWTRYRDGFNNRRIHAIDVDPESKSCVYAGSVAGLYRTTNLGKSWELISDEGMVINAIGLHPRRPERIVLGTERDGVYVSHDRGLTFKRSNRGLRNVRVTSMVADPSSRDRLFAAVSSGAAASGIYQSNDAGTTWARISTTKLPEILSLIIQTGDAKFLAGTDKGIYWSADGVSWTESTPAEQPFRVDKIVRYNSTRLFAATSDGVLTSKDSGKSWYRLANSTERAVDIAVGRLAGARALYALTGSGLIVFDGEQWLPIEGAPERGRALAIRENGEMETVMVASSQGIRAGRVDFGRRWQESQVPASSSASVYQTDGGVQRTVFLASREPHELFVNDVAGNEWRKIWLPIQSKEIMSIASDPFDPTRFFVGTSGEGVYVYRDAPFARLAAGSGALAAGSK